MKVSQVVCRSLAGALAAVAAWTAPSVSAQETVSGTKLVTNQEVHPAGKTVEFNGRPVDVALNADGSLVFAKDNRGVVVIDTATMTVKQEIGFGDDGGSMTGIVVSAGGAVYATDSTSYLIELKPDEAGKYAVSRRILLPGIKKGEKTAHSFPCGIVLKPDTQIAYVCLSMNNSLAEVDLGTGTVVREMLVGVAPFAVQLDPTGNIAVVSNWGGRRPGGDGKTAPSAGTDVSVDERGIANSGTASIVDLRTGVAVKELDTGLSASGVAVAGSLAFVANANSDTVSMLSLSGLKDKKTGQSLSVDGKFLKNIDVKPDAKLPFGSMPNAVVADQRTRRVYVSLAGNNAIAVYGISRNVQQIELGGLIPTGWYPGGMALDTTKKALYVANIKGVGMRRPDEVKFNSKHYRGSVTRVELPPVPTLRAWTNQVLADGRVPQILKAMERGEKDAELAPVPTKAGQKSPIEHVIYFIKENRTYDQVLSDLDRGNRDPSLCLFGRDVTPNHHALAEEFVLLDNYYCGGVLSADGHSWATEGNVTPYLERSFGGFHRSYTFGDDPLTYSSSGFLWDHVLAAGLSFRNYGEFDYAETEPKGSYKEIYDDFVAGGKKYTFKQKIGIERLKRYSCEGYPGWNMKIPDVVRADVFIRDFKAMDEAGTVPNLMIVHLPNDHTEGTSAGVPTPSSYMADNDLALGRIVEAVTKSKVWGKTAIFVTEDDPQNGFDHVDGHRSLCLVISPYAKRGETVSTFYSQPGVVHTIQRIFGITAANQLSAAANVFSDCFTMTPNLKPYEAIVPKTPLCELNVKKAEIENGEQMRFAELSEKLPLEKPDLIDDDTLNRIVWAAVKGWDTPYPAQWSGAHGKGLEKLGLKKSDLGGDDDDDD